MANWIEILVAIVCWLAIVLGIYMFINPTENPTPEKINNFAIYTFLSGILVIIILFIIRGLSGKDGAYILPLATAISEVPFVEKAMIGLRPLNELDSRGCYPVDGGKKTLLRYLAHDGKYRGRVLSAVINCMSDYKSSASDISRMSRLESFSIEPLSEAGAKRALVSTTKTPLDKVISATKELRKLKEQGGDTAVSLAESLSDKEEAREEG